MNGFLEDSDEPLGEDEYPDEDDYDLEEDDLKGQPLSVLPAPKGVRSKPGATTTLQQSARTVAQPEAISSSPAVSTNPPATAATTSAPVSVPAEPPASTLSTTERHAKMNAELKALSEDFVTEANAMNVAFQEDMKNASTDAQRLEILREYNTETAEMRTRVESETQAIKDRYKD